MTPGAERTSFEGLKSAGSQAESLCFVGVDIGILIPEELVAHIAKNVMVLHGYTGLHSSAPSKR